MAERAKIKFWQGLETNRSGITPDEGVPIWVTDTQKLYIGDGSTAGGIAVDSGGDVTKVGTPVDNQIGVWTGDGTLEGDANFIFIDGGTLRVTSNDAGAAAGPSLQLYRNSASPDAADELGQIIFRGEDSGGATHDYARIWSEIYLETNLVEAGYLKFAASKGGSLDTFLYYEGGLGSITAYRESTGTVGRILNFFLDSSSPAVSDILGIVRFSGKNSATGTHAFSQIYGVATNVTDASEASELQIWNSTGGTITHQFTFESDGSLHSELTNYESLVTDPDDIPNKQYVDDAAGAGIAVTGTPANNQIAIWDDANTLEGDAKLTWNTSTDILVAQSTDAGATAGPSFWVERNSASPAADDKLGVVSFAGRDSVGGTIAYANMQGVITSPTAGAAVGRLETYVNFISPTLVQTLSSGANTLHFNNSGAAAGPTFILDRDSSSPAANDQLGSIIFRGRDSVDLQSSYATIFSEIVSPTTTQEDGKLVFTLLDQGNTLQAMTITADGGFVTTELASGDNSAAAAPYLNLRRYSNSAADDDALGVLGFQGSNSAFEGVDYGNISAVALDVTDGQEEGEVRIGVMSNGALIPDAFSVSGKASTGDFQATFHSTYAGPAGPQLHFFHDSASPAADDVIALIQFDGNDAGSNSNPYADIQVRATAVGVGSEQGQFRFRIANQSNATKEAVIIQDGAAGHNELIVTEFESDAIAGPLLIAQRISESPAAADLIGQVVFQGSNGSPSFENDVPYATIMGEIETTGSSEDGILRVYNMKAGTSTHHWSFESDGSLHSELTNYETLVTADDDIPNKKYVDDRDIAITGTPVDGQIAVWTGAAGLEGDANFTWDGTTTVLALQSDDAGAGAGPLLTLDRNSASPAIFDFVGLLNFQGRSSTGVARSYASLVASIISPTNGSEDGALNISLLDQGTENTSLQLANSAGSHTASFLSDSSGAEANPLFSLSRASASPAVNDLLGSLSWDGYNSAAESVSFASLIAAIVDPVDATEDGELRVYNIKAGTSTHHWTLESDGSLHSELTNYETLVTDDDDIPNKRYVDNNMQLDATPDTDHTANGPTTNTLNAAATIAIGELVYLDSTGEWALTDADAEATSIGMLGIALAAGTDGNPMNVALSGSFVRDDTWAWTTGDELYISTTPGDLTATAPSATGDVVRVVGYAVSADVVYFLPSGSWVTVA